MTIVNLILTGCYKCKHAVLEARVRLLSLYTENTADVDILLVLVQKLQYWSGLKISTRNQCAFRHCSPLLPLPDDPMAGSRLEDSHGYKASSIQKRLEYRP